jgi:hypothetical protein
MARGGAMGYPGRSETSASGAGAFALRDSSGRSVDSWCQTQVPAAFDCPPHLYRCQRPRPIMLEHLSSFPTQMVRVRPGVSARHSGAWWHRIPLPVAVPIADGYCPSSFPNYTVGSSSLSEGFPCPCFSRILDPPPPPPETHKFDSFLKPLGSPLVLP